MPIRLVVISLWCAWLAACAIPSHAPAAAEPPCRVGGFEFRSDFESGALQGCRAGASGPVLVIAPEYAPINPSPWYAWRVAPAGLASAEPLPLVVTQRYLHGEHRYAPWVSTDGEAWRPLPASQVTSGDDGSITLAFSVPPGGLYVAAQPPLTSRAMNQWATALAAAHGLGSTTVAESVEGRAVRAWLYDRPGQVAALVLIGRQHPPEVTGGLAYRDFVERLFDADPLATRFRERYAIGLVPELNPDGVIGGHWRTNARGVDLNRDWGPFTQPETRGVAEWMASLDRQVPLGLFIDFHSTSQDVFYMPHPSDDPAPAGFATAWRTNLERRLGSAMPDWSGDHNPGLPTAKSWVRQHHGVFAMTYEVGDNTPRDRIREVARIAAEETMTVLLELESAE